jgi:hypothetical protein
MSERKEPAGPIQLKRKVHPPIEVDCSCWNKASDNDVCASGPLLLQRQAFPPLQIDCSHAPSLPISQLHVEFEPSGNPQEVAVAVLQLYQTISNFECGLGGEGLVESNSAENGNVQLVLSARNPAGAQERLARIADVLNQSTAPTIALPKEIGNIRVRAA